MPKAYQVEPTLMMDGSGKSVSITGPITLRLVKGKAEERMLRPRRATAVKRPRIVKETMQCVDVMVLTIEPGNK